MKISKKDALTWFRFFAELPEGEPLGCRQQEIALSVFSQIEAAVDALCDDDRATLQTNVSRIKRKLVDKLGRLAADQYAIIRGRDGVYRIAVPRDLVAMPV